MIACPSKIRFSRVLSLGVGVRSIIAGIRPFADVIVRILVLEPFEDPFLKCLFEYAGEGKGISSCDRRKVARRTVDLQVPILLLHILCDIDVSCRIFDSQLLERD
jgi:hypothetical protein